MMNGNNDNSSQNKPSNDTKNEQNLHLQLGDQMQAVMELMSKRSRGEATNDEVEAAVSEILSVMKPPTHIKREEESINEKTKVLKPHEEHVATRQITQDTGDYDDEEDDDNDKPESTTPPSSSKTDNDGEINRKNQVKNEDNDELYREQITVIPMGKQGAQMMTTFGDGQKPIPESVSAALLGTRRCLQVALLDARALRRHAKKTYAQARQALLSPVTGDSNNVVDPDMQYRAMSGYDKLSYDPKCGFDIEQLRQLFPEEIRAYTRWKDLHSAYQDGAEADDNNKGQNTDNDDNDENKDKDSESKITKEAGGHLQERAAQFDIRTERMKSDWYMKFSKVRQGSFLPRGKRHRKTDAEIQWDENRKAEFPKGGRRSVGVWETMSAASVQFLHWMGFDPPAMPPPNDETTQALAFLSYDFLGKIVEKAVFLRNLQRLRRNHDEIDETKVLWDLKPGEQLTPEDIGDAMKDPDIRPMPLHNVESTCQPSVQLYFGPGFEERLELEMDELIANRRTLSEEEKRIRQDEAKLFAKLAEPPRIVDSVVHLMEKLNQNKDKKGKDSASEMSPIVNGKEGKNLEDKHKEDEKPQDYQNDGESKRPTKTSPTSRRKRQLDKSNEGSSPSISACPMATGDAGTTQKSSTGKSSASKRPTQRRRIAKSKHQQYEYTD